jgi:hypothetical protein
MKRIFLSAIMLATAYTLFAQDPVPYRATDVNTTTYTVPPSMKTNFQVSYPNATTVTWQPMNDWWYATYKNDNNRIISVYYNTQPYYLIRNESFIVALPVINTMVPEEVITKAISTYGNDLYSITAMKSAGSDEMMYQVTLIKNGTTETVMMNGSGVAYNNNNSTNTIPQ